MAADQLMSLGSIITSLGVGLITFYFISDSAKEKRKVLIEEVIAQIIHFIIFIWLGKIVLNFMAFIKNPLVILAYPSNSEAFYLAVLLSAGTLFYKSKRAQTNISVFIEAFIPVFLAASFLYEFIQVIGNDRTYAPGNLTLFTSLFILYLLIQGHAAARMKFVVMLAGWAGGSALLLLVQPFVTLFGYIIAPWFIGLFFITSLSIIIYHWLMTCHSPPSEPE